MIMVRYIIATKDAADNTTRYISRYTPSSEKNRHPIVMYTRYRTEAQIFSAAELKSIPNVLGVPIELKL